MSATEQYDHLLETLASHPAHPVPGDILFLTPDGRAVELLLGGAVRPRPDLQLATFAQLGDVRCHYIGTATEVISGPFLWAEGAHEHWASVRERVASLASTYAPHFGEDAEVLASAMIGCEDGLWSWRPCPQYQVVGMVRHPLNPDQKNAWVRDILLARIPRFCVGHDDPGGFRSYDLVPAHTWACGKGFRGALTPRRIESAPEQAFEIRVPFVRRDRKLRVCHTCAGDLGWPLVAHRADWVWEYKNGGTFGFQGDAPKMITPHKECGACGRMGEEEFIRQPIVLVGSWWASRGMGNWVDVWSQPVPLAPYGAMRDTAAAKMADYIQRYPSQPPPSDGRWLCGGSSTTPA